MINFNDGVGFNARLDVVSSNQRSGIYLIPDRGIKGKKDIMGHVLKELAIVIFELLKMELPNLALVNKQFAKIADDKELIRKIFPYNKAFTEKDYEKYYEVEVVGKVPLLPRRAYGDIERKGGRLTLVPQKVKVVLDVVPLTKELMGKLAKNAKSEYQIGYHPNSWQAAIEPKTSLTQKICCCLPTSLFAPSEEAMHWLWTEELPIGHGLYYDTREGQEGQEALAMRQELSLGVTGGADVVELRDGIVVSFTTFNKTGKGCFDWDSNTDYEGTLIRSKNKVEGWRPALSFGPSGLLVRHDYVYADANVGVAVARKSFVH